MLVSISDSTLLTVTDAQTQRSFFGGDQAWYTEEWWRQAGCGPTCAANMTAYLALTRPHLRALYSGTGMDRGGFIRHMEEIYPYVQPGPMGLNRVERFTEGVTAFAADRGIALTAHVFVVSGNRDRNRPPVSALADFVREGLASDCPVGFLNLSCGREKNLQSWHWISLASADIGADAITACASDEGVLREFDLKLWYLSTRMRGGLVYFG